MAKAEITQKWYKVDTDAARVVDLKEPQLVACPLNPLDIPRNRLSAFDVVVMPPVSILTNSRVTGPCCRLISDEFFKDTKKDYKFVPMHMSYFGGEVTRK